MSTVAISRRRTIFTILRNATLLVSVIICSDTVGTAILSIVLRRNLFPYYTLLTLVEAGLLFLIGGALDLASSLAFTRITDRVVKEQSNFDKHKQAQHVAAAFIVTGVILMILSFILAYPLN